MDLHPVVRRAVDGLSDDVRSLKPGTDVLQLFVDRAVSDLPSVDHASVTLLNGKGRISTLVASDPVAFEIDRLQYKYHEGPCYEAVHGGRYLVATDLTQDGRWPTFGPMAVERGVRALLAFEVVHDTTRNTALNFGSSEPDGFGDSVELVEQFVGQTTLAMSLGQTVGDLQQAVESRQTIGSAIGIVMERFQVDEESAFRYLARLSMTENTKLREVAERLVRDTSQRSDSAG